MRAAIYTRISRAEAGDNTGVLRHAEYCRDLCTLRGYEVIDTYEDNDISAVSKKRPAYERLLRDMRNGMFDIVVAYEQSRLARDPATWALFQKTYVDAGLSDIEFVHGGTVNLASASGRMVGGITTTVNTYEREVIIQRIRDKHEKLALEGKWHGGRRPFGFTPVLLPGVAQGTTLEINESEAVWIRAAAQSVLTGGSLSAICRQWNDPGGPVSVTGKPWSITVIRALLKRPGLAGLREHKGERTPALWPAIISEATWQQVCDVLANPARRTMPKVNAKREYPLRGILVCGECGRHLVAGNFRVRAYSCRRLASKKQASGCGKVFVRAEPIEAWVEEHLVPLADNPKLRDTVAEAEGIEVDRLVGLVAENAKAEARLAELAEAAATGEISLKTLGQVTKSLEAQIADRSEQIAGMSSASDLNQWPVGQVVAAWPTMTSEDKRKLLLALVRCIEVSSGKGSGPKFRSDRVTVKWRLEAISKLVDWEQVWPKIEQALKAKGLV